MKVKSLPQGWKVDKLGNIAEINTGNPAPQGKEFFGEGCFPFVRVQDLGRYGQTTNLIETTDKVNERAIKECGLTLFPKGTILFPKSGMSTLLNHRAILGIDAYVVSHLAALIPKKDIIGEYLYYYLCTIDMARWSQRTNLPSLRTSIISEIDIPVPSLLVQKRIVAILNKSNAIQQKRQEALRIAEQIIPSLFLEMFGDPGTNSKGFPVGSLSQVITEWQPGFACGKKHEKNGIPHLRMNNLTTLGLMNFDLVRTVGKTKNHEKYLLLPGDLLFNNTNSPDLVGKCAIFRKSGEYYFSNHLTRIRVKEPYTTEWLCGLFLVFWKQGLFRRMCRQWVNQASLVKEHILELKVPLPINNPQLLRIHQESIRSLEGHIAKLKQVLDAAEATLETLLSQAFTGELTASWEAEYVEEITTQIAVLERLPKITLLAFVRRFQQQMRQRAVLVTALMKYAFLFQMEGRSRQPIYNFVPYKFGPFTKEVYSDLYALQDEGLLSVKKGGRTASREDVFRVAEELATYRTAKDEYYIEISIPYGKDKQVDAAIKELDEQILNDIDLIINKYGHMDHDALLDVVYKKYPRFARRSQRKRRK